MPIPKYKGSPVKVAIKKAATKKAVTKKPVTKVPATKKAATKKAVTKKAATNKPATKSDAKPTITARAQAKAAPAMPCSKPTKQVGRRKQPSVTFDIPDSTATSPPSTSQPAATPAATPPPAVLSSQPTSSPLAQSTPNSPAKQPMHRKGRGKLKPQALDEAGSDDEPNYHLSDSESDYVATPKKKRRMDEETSESEADTRKPKAKKANRKRTKVTTAGPVTKMRAIAKNIQQFPIQQDVTEMEEPSDTEAEPVKTKRVRDPTKAKPKTNKECKMHPQYRQTYTADALQAAVDAVLINGEPVRTTARLYGVPRGTLKQYKENGWTTVRKLGRDNVFDYQLECKFTERILEYSERGFGPTITALLEDAYKFANDMKLNHRFNNEAKSAGWS